MFVTFLELGEIIDNNQDGREHVVRIIQLMPVVVRQGGIGSQHLLPGLHLALDQPEQLIDPLRLGGVNRSTNMRHIGDSLETAAAEVQREDV